MDKERVSKSQSRNYTARINTTPEEKEKLSLYAQKKNLSMGLIVSDFISKGVEYDIYDPKWIEKLEKFIKKVDAYSRSENQCKAVTWIGEKEHWICVWGREGKPPLVRKIGKDLHDRNWFCAACVDTRALMARIEGYEEELGRLRARVAATTIDIPFCKKGGELHTDGKQIYCVDGLRVGGGGGKYVSVESFCMKRKGGYACDYLKRKPINVSLESKEDNR